MFRAILTEPTLAESSPLILVEHHPTPNAPPQYKPVHPPTPNQTTAEEEEEEGGPPPLVTIAL